MLLLMKKLRDVDVLFVLGCRGSREYYEVFECRYFNKEGDKRLDACGKITGNEDAMHQYTPRM